MHAKSIDILQRMQYNKKKSRNVERNVNAKVYIQCHRYWMHLYNLKKKKITIQISTIPVEFSFFDFAFLFIWFFICIERGRIHSQFTLFFVVYCHGCTRAVDCVLLLLVLSQSRFAAFRKKNFIQFDYSNSTSCATIKDFYSMFAKFSFFFFFLFGFKLLISKFELFFLHIKVYG